MPTGYTADVADGKVTDFRTFALRCARAFGATIMQRDNPMDELPKHREPSSYEAQRVETARADIARWDAMTVAEAQNAMLAEYEARLSQLREWQAKSTEEQNRYNAMAAQVVHWTPPTPDHDGLKSFMLEQLRMSREGSDWVPKPPPRPEISDAASWLALKREAARQSLANALEALNEEELRCAKANAWIDALYQSVSSLPSPTRSETE